MSSASLSQVPMAMQRIAKGLLTISESQWQL